ncbi:MAG TPA: T6SS immunity protein Tdi1 domain-containing protein, partial [Urbifossiella sp.]|nr:T6SS immunity protein Tdi1 domain-containing protein [Urbifossiella sp.]
EFCARIDEGTTAHEWLMIPLVDQLVAAGVVLAPGTCYGFKTPPVLGGEYAVDNVGPLPIPDYLGAYGSIHKQLRDLPDGTQVVLEVTD